MKLFFYRLDYIRKACIVLVLPTIIFLFFSRVAFRYLYIFAPVTILITIGALLLFPHRRPTNEKILSDITELHQKHLRKAKKENSKADDENFFLVEGFSSVRRLLSRKLGTQLIFPVCRTLVFLKGDSEWDMYIYDASLMKPAPSETKGKSHSFDANHPIVLDLLNYNENTQSIFLSFSIDGNTVEVVTRMKFRIKELCASVKNNFALTDKMAKFLE